MLVVTNLLTIAALAVALRRRQRDDPSETEVFAAPRPAGVSGRDRRLITVEILNPIELATARGGRVAGLAGTLAPGFTRRLVYEQTLRILRRELTGKDVLADVRVHNLRTVAQAVGAQAVRSPRLAGRTWSTPPSSTRSRRSTCATHRPETRTALTRGGPLPRADRLELAGQRQQQRLCPGTTH